MVARLNERQYAYRRIGRVEGAMEVGELHPPLLNSKLKLTEPLSTKIAIIETAKRQHVQ